jgi:glycosyltransferase involved in cell wall biosynthesis
MHVLYSFPDVVGKAGIGTTAYQQVNEVAKSGVEVTLYCTTLTRELPESVRVVETLSLLGRRVPHRMLGIDRSYRYHDRRVAAALRRIGSGIDLVHCWPRATVATASAARHHMIPSFREIPNTHTAHAFEVVAREAETLGLASARSHSHAFDEAILELEEREYEVADVLLVPSEYSLSTFRERGVPAEKLALHRYGFDPTRFRPPPSPPDGSRRGLTAVFVGRCEPRKGLHHALRAWRNSGACEDGRFVVCGTFEPAYREVLEPLLAHPSIEVRGFVADPVALMQESDLLILPSLEEGSALVTYEARACGCVLVVSEAAGARCSDGVDGLVHPPGDVAALTEHLGRLLAEPELLPRLRAASLAGASELSWEAAARELVELYRRSAER